MGKFQKYVVNNFGLKLLSLALAVGLWLVLQHNPIAEVAVEVPIVFRNVPDHLGVSNGRIPQVQILLRGPERAVSKLQPTDVHAEIDLSSGRPGEHAFTSSDVRVYKPYELEVVNKSPDKFQITFVDFEKAPSLPTGTPK